MNSGLGWKLIVGFVVVFLAGATTGFFVSASFTRHLFLGPHHEGMRDRLRSRLQTELSLTDEQLTKITPIIDKTAKQLEQIRAETGRRVHETFLEAHREIAVDLTPSQQAKLQEIESRRRHWFRHKHGTNEASPQPFPSASAQ